MKRVLEITVDLPPMSDTVDMWTTVMEIPPTINDLKRFCEIAAKDFPNRKVRIVEILEAD